MFEEECKSLRREIEAAFRDVPSPDRDEFLAADCVDDSEVSAFYPPEYRRNWQLVPVEMIDCYYDIFSFFSPKAFQFFLPAYMWRAIDTLHARNNVLEFLLYKLVPSSEFLDRLTMQRCLLSETQHRAVRRFLIFVEKFSDNEQFSELARKGLSVYWCCGPER